jgi:hypothetical protein
MRTVGLEPTHLAVLEPKSSASTNFARLAGRGGYHAAVRVNTLPSALALGLAVMSAACGDPGPSTPAKPASPPAAPVAAPAPAPAPTATLAQLRDDVPLALTRLLGRPVAEVQAQLGDPLGKGMVRDSCVRYVPERVFFTCQYAQQRYADTTGNFEAVRVGYEDGVATEVAYDGWKHGSGAFTPEALLAGVGLVLPEAGTQTSPADGVKLWSWFNSQARLKIAERQHRVEVSITRDDWALSRVEVLLNDPLTPEQQARVRTPGPLISGTP